MNEVSQVVLGKSPANARAQASARRHTQVRASTLKHTQVRSSKRRGAQAHAGARKHAVSVRRGRTLTQNIANLEVLNEVSQSVRRNRRRRRRSDTNSEHHQVNRPSQN